MAEPNDYEAEFNQACDELYYSMLDADARHCSSQLDLWLKRHWNNPRIGHSIRNHGTIARLALSKNNGCFMHLETKEGEINHIVLLIHGIKDPGAWQQVSRTLEEATTGLRVIRLRFGVWSALAFISPLPFFLIAQARLKREIVSADHAHNHPRISIIAHSFGTFLVLRLLRKNTHLKLWKLIFCGSVAADLADWSPIAHKVGHNPKASPNRDARTTDHYIVNDCGTADIWPLVGAASGWYYGMAGVLGFNETYVRNRFHDGGHSLFFDDAFVQKYWKSFLVDDRFERSTKVQGKDIKAPYSWLYYSGVRWLVRVAAILPLIVCFWLGIYFLQPAAANLFRRFDTRTVFEWKQNTQLIASLPTFRQLPVKGNAWVTNRKSLLRVLRELDLDLNDTLETNREALVKAVEIAPSYELDPAHNISLHDVDVLILDQIKQDIDALRNAIRSEAARRGVEIDGSP
jgi:hypothetical protein